MSAQDVDDAIAYFEAMADLLSARIGSEVAMAKVAKLEGRTDEQNLATEAVLRLERRHVGTVLSALEKAKYGGGK